MNRSDADVQRVFDHASLQDAEDALRVATELGYEPPVFPGSHVYLAFIIEPGDGLEGGTTEELGVFASEAAAKVAVRNWVVNRYYELGEHPLLENSEEEENEETDYSRFADETIIKEYFQYWEDTHNYHILRAQVSGMPEREM